MSVQVLTAQNSAASIKAHVFNVQPTLTPLTASVHKDPQGEGFVSQIPPSAKVLYWGAYLILLKKVHQGHRKENVER